MPHLEALAVRLDRLDPIGWSDRFTTAFLILWVGVGLLLALVFRASAVMVVLPTLGLVIWRVDGIAMRPILLWTVPLACALALTTQLPEPPQLGILLALLGIGLMLTFTGGARRRWLSLAEPAHLVRPDEPGSAGALRSALAPVDHALSLSMRDRDTRRVAEAVAQARSTIATLDIPESDAAHDVARLAGLWLRDVESIALDPDQGAEAYAAVNRRARQLHHAELALARRIGGRPPR